MQPLSQISRIWQVPDASQAYTTGVSLHSHTSFSVETLNFVHAVCSSVPFVDKVVAHYGRLSKERYNLTLDFDSAHWRPPLLPLMAFELERKQILSLGLDPLVSITDHDNIHAPMLLRTIPVARRIPFSVEWTVPFRSTAFHVGIHNLPSPDAPDWMERLERFTAAPDDQQLRRMLRELDAIPQVLIVLNHPMWDLYKIGDRNHAMELDRFLAQNNGQIHALELNGLRHARENRQVMELARRWSQLMISGGDRHGLEPNANINLTNVTSFSAFVREIRVERRSHVLFLQQYARPWEQRILESTLDAVSDHPQFSPGWQRWDERAFHLNAAGEMRSMAELWPRGKAPLALRLAIQCVRLFRHRALAHALSLAVPQANVDALDSDVMQEIA